MAKTNSPPATGPTKPTVDEDLPTLVSLGMMEQSKQKWVAYAITSRGRTILEQEILTDGAVPRAHAENVLKVELVKRFIMPVHVTPHAP